MTSLHKTGKRFFAIVLALSLALMMPTTAFAQPEDSAANAGVAAGGVDGTQGSGSDEGAGNQDDGSGNEPGADAGANGIAGEEAKAGSQSNATSDPAKTPQFNQGVDGEGVLVGAEGDPPVVTICSKNGDGEGALVENYVAPEAVHLEVYLDGKSIPADKVDKYNYAWYQRAITDRGEIWVSYFSPRDVEQTSNVIDIPATVASQVGSPILYCEVFDGVTPLNPIIAEPDEGEEISKPMKEVIITVKEVSVVIATPNGLVGLTASSSDPDSGVALDTTGTAISLNDTSILASGFKDDWTLAALSVEVPEGDDFRDISIEANGSKNALECVLPLSNENQTVNIGWGLYIEAAGTHTITIEGNSLSVTGGFQGFYAGGDNGQGKVDYIFDGGLELDVKNEQTGPVKFPGALMFSRSSATFNDVHASLTSNAPIVVNCYRFDENDLAKDVVFNQGAVVDIIGNGEGFTPIEPAPSKGISIDFGDLYINGAQVSVSMTNVEALGVVGIDTWKLSMCQGGLLNISIDQSQESKSANPLGMKIFDGFTIDASTLNIECIGQGAGSGSTADGIISNGASSSIVNGSKVTVSSQADAATYGITCVTTARDKYESALMVENSIVSVQANSNQKNAVGLAADKLSFTESAGKTVTANAAGGTYSVAIMATELYSAPEPKNYTEGYTPVLWSFGANTGIVTPASGEINLFTFEDPMVKYITGESVYAPGVTDKAAQEVVIGYKKSDPGPAPKPIPPTGDPLAALPVGAVVLATLAGLTLLLAVACRRWYTFVIRRKIS